MNVPVLTDMCRCQVFYMIRANQTPRKSQQYNAGVRNSYIRNLMGAVMCTRAHQKAHQKAHTAHAALCWGLSLPRAKINNHSARYPHPRPFLDFRANTTPALGVKRHNQCVVSSCATLKRQTNQSFRIQG